MYVSWQPYVEPGFAKMVIHLARRPQQAVGRSPARYRRRPQCPHGSIGVTCTSSPSLPGVQVFERRWRTARPPFGTTRSRPIQAMRRALRDPRSPRRIPGRGAEIDGRPGKLGLNGWIINSHTWASISMRRSTGPSSAAQALRHADLSASREPGVDGDAVSDTLLLPGWASPRDRTPCHGA